MKEKLRELLFYLIFGILTTLINIVCYRLLRYLGINYLISNLISFIISILFAYITNRNYVFKSNSKHFKEIILEIIHFISFRLFSLLFDMLFMIVMIEFIKIDDFYAKIITNIIVVILNYLFSKKYIFKS